MHLEPPYRVALAHLAELDLLEGRPDAAVARLAPFERADLTWTDGALLHAILAGAYVALGDLARAEPVADRAVAEARRMGTWIHGIGALRIQALVEARRGKVEQARKTLEDGLQRARCMPFPYGEARLLEAYALLERHCSDDASAEARLSEALAIFKLVGATRDSERLRAAVLL